MAGPPFDIDESSPSNTGIVSQFPADERAMRDIVESWLLVDHDTNGEHAKVTLPEGADPSSAANKGILYAKDVSALTELFYRDSGGTIIQLTKAGQASGAIPAGTTMFFGQASAPTGWTQNVTWNDRVLRVVSGSGAGTSGSWTISGLSAGNTGSTTLSIAQMPPHTHLQDAQTALRTAGSVVDVQGASHAKGGTTPSTGGGAGHTHPGPTISSDASWRPSLLDVIAADKD